jgi:hypothetical protein
MKRQRVTSLVYYRRDIDARTKISEKGMAVRSGLDISDSCSHDQKKELVFILFSSLFISSAPCKSVRSLIKTHR